MSPFFDLTKVPLLALLQSVLAERRRFLGKKLDLVWSGSDAGTSYTRYTKIVVPELNPHEFGSRLRATPLTAAQGSSRRSTKR